MGIFDRAKNKAEDEAENHQQDMGQQDTGQQGGMQDSQQGGMQTARDTIGRQGGGQGQGMSQGQGQSGQDMGQGQHAARAYTQALALDPHWPAVNVAVARRLATAADPGQRDPQTALELAEEVCQAIPEPSAEALDVLAAAQAALRRK